MLNAVLLAASVCFGDVLATAQETQGCVDYYGFAGFNVSSYPFDCATDSECYDQAEAALVRWVSLNCEGDDYVYRCWVGE